MMWVNLILFLQVFGHSLALDFPPKCMVNENYQTMLVSVSWATVNLDESAKERFVSAYAPFSSQIQEMVTEVRQTIGSFGTIVVKFMEVFIGHALESLFTSDYLQEIEGISKATNISMEDLALLNAFYELTRFCTSILAKDSNGNLLHGRNLDFGQFFGGWDPKTHKWRLTESLKKMSINLDFKRQGKTQFKGTTFAGHVGLLSGFKPKSFSLTINARLRPNFRNLIRWLAHMLKPQPNLVLWTVREVLDKKPTFREAYEYLSNVPQIADSYYILGGVKSDEAVIIVRNQTNVVETKSMTTNEWFLLQTNYDPGKPPFYLDDRQTPGKECMKQLNSTSLSISALLRVLSSKPTLNKTTVHSILMHLASDEYYSFVQKCPDPCWFI